MNRQVCWYINFIYLDFSVHSENIMQHKYFCPVYFNVFMAKLEKTTSFCSAGKLSAILLIV